MPRSLRSPFRRDLIKHSPSANGRYYGVDAATRTLQLRLEVDNADEALKPGMNARLQLNTANEPMLLISVTSAD